MTRYYDFNHRGAICAFDQECEKEALTREELVISRTLKDLNARYFVVMKRIRAKARIPPKPMITTKIFQILAHLKRQKMRRAHRKSTWTWPSNSIMTLQPGFIARIR